MKYGCNGRAPIVTFGKKPCQFTLSPRGPQDSRCLGCWERKEPPTLMDDLINYGMAVTLDAKRINPLDVYRTGEKTVRKLYKVSMRTKAGMYAQYISKLWKKPRQSINKQLRNIMENSQDLNEPVAWFIDVTEFGKSVGRYEVADKEYWGIRSICIPLYAAPQDDRLRKAAQMALEALDHFDDVDLTEAAIEALREALK